MFEPAEPNRSSDSASPPGGVRFVSTPGYAGNERRVSISPPMDALGPPAGSSFGRRSSDTYLESMIATASPAKLRLMVIERGVEVARHLAKLWRETPGKRGTNEHSLKLFELLTELLSGVTDSSVEVCRTVADLYVFLCQHLIAAEENGDAAMIDEIRLVLETEAETWRMVCAQESGHSPQSRTANVLSRVGGGAGAVPGSLNLQG